MVSGTEETTPRNQPERLCRSGLDIAPPPPPPPPLSAGYLLFSFLGTSNSCLARNDDADVACCSFSALIFSLSVFFFCTSSEDGLWAGSGNLKPERPDVLAGQIDLSYYVGCVGRRSCCPWDTCVLTGRRL